MSPFEEFQDDDREEHDPWVCQFPGECCMAGDHRASECHTPEMIEEYERECEQRKADR